LLLANTDLIATPSIPFAVEHIALGFFVSFCKLMGPHVFLKTLKGLSF
jgi:hypothetical protein